MWTAVQQFGRLNFGVVMSLAVLVFLGVAITASVLTLGVRRYTLAKSILDIPNHRSSHTTPVPRGGGLAIAATALVAMVVAGAFGLVPLDVSIAMTGGGSLIALVGWLDDNRGVAARWRAAVHFLAAGWALFWLGGFPKLNVGGADLYLGWVGGILAAVGIVWLTNLYNFMDGIDGIAGGEAVFAGLVGGGLLWGAGHVDLAIASLIIAAASSGFLVWNWSPAKIFMGDVGSGLLGYLFAVLAVASENSGALPLVLWILLLGAFVFDATVTLVRRAARGERWYDAHRSHAYQRAVQAGWSHGRVTGTVLGLNGALALLAWFGSGQAEWLLLCIAGGVLILSTGYVLVERVRPMSRREPNLAAEDRGSVHIS